ncbi:MAG: lipopolysaccharide biosynthesis protein [Clostridium sp.]|nr:lipopolysaccharide biosynthesis protein [Prevotella sp.]MCM1429778.1 lipopolysaccharide biosynthesis protein [Clostridium sp.]MCM1474708.1 lipopolysaccharide biosynthesis protein [Muribaculaceae bacterium]
MASLGHKAATGALWATGTKLGYMILQFTVNLILARLLLPADFGIIGMLMIFIAVSQTLLDGGFGAALIQKKEPTQEDFSTVFMWNIGIGSLLYAILFVGAPFVADFYRMPQLCNVLRIFGISVIIDGIVAVQTTRLRKHLAFKQLSLTSIGAYSVSAAFGITAAMMGAGVWSLVGMNLISGLMNAGILYIVTRWRPSLHFSLLTLRGLFSFGGYMLAAQVLQEICKNVQGMVIGRKFSATQMGYYSQAYKLDMISSYTIPQMIVQVMYPVYSEVSEDTNKLAEILRLSIRVITLAMWPTMGLLIVVAHPLIGMLYGRTWLPAAPYFQIMCVGGLFVCLQNVNFYAVAARGKSRDLFYWSFYKWSFMFAAVIGGAFFGMAGIVWGIALSNLNIYVVNAWLASRNSTLGLWAQFRLLIPPGIGLIVGIVAAGGCELLLGSHWLICGGVFIVAYLAMSAICNRQSLLDCKVLYKKIREK